MTSLADDRLSAIHLLRAGHTVQQVAEQLGHSERWVRKWWQRYQAEHWVGLAERSRVPHHCAHQLPACVRQQILVVRSALEAQAANADGLKYIGAPALRTRLQAQGCQPLPSLASIERVLHGAGLTHARLQTEPPVLRYPQLQPAGPQQLCQIDIVPHYLTGGAHISCFNAIDVVSRCATGAAYAEHRAQDACRFAIQVWQTLGVPVYTQFDNDSCFDGGHTHPHVLGQVVRLALLVGTEVLFSPARHPESNGYVERFHQEYNRHVWQDTYLADLAAVTLRADRFFSQYNASGHHAALHGATPQTVHGQPTCRLAPDFERSAERLPLYEGRLHFIRQVQTDGTVAALNVPWPVPNPPPQQAVWVTIELRPADATLAIYNAAPDASVRRCLASYPFPVQEAILPRPADAPGRPSPLGAPPAVAQQVALTAPPPKLTLAAGITFVFQAFLAAGRRACKATLGTMF